MPENSADKDYDPRYVALVRWVLWEFDMASELNDQHGASDHGLGRVDGLLGVVSWLRGFENTDLDGLRERFAERS